jgi:hypothetical protein
MIDAVVFKLFCGDLIEREDNVSVGLEAPFNKVDMFELLETVDDAIFVEFVVPDIELFEE